MRESIVRMIREQNGDTLAHLATLTGDQWDEPSPCDGWRVRDVLAHQVEGELVIGRAYRGEPLPEGFIDLTDLSRWDPLPAEAVVASLWQHSAASLRVLEALDDERWHGAIDVFGCRRISQLARLHLFEAIVHGFDLGVRSIPEDRLGFALEFAVRAAPAALARHVGDPLPSVRVVSGDRGWTIGGEPVATLTAEPLDLLLAVTGRGALDRVTTAGDEATAMRALDGWQVTR